MTRVAARATIADSPLFDAAWYLERYPHVIATGQDPALHYLLLGAGSGCDPGPRFSTRGYLAANPDVARAGINPLLHYEQVGRTEGRRGRVPDGPVGGAGDSPAPMSLTARLDALRSGAAPGLGFTRRADPQARALDRIADYAVLTPTGDRPQAFNRCLDMVAAQTVQPKEWIVVDDGVIPLTDQIVLPDWVTYLRRPPDPSDPPHTLSVNLPPALDQITADRVLIVEDDDWYAPLYAEYLLPFLDAADLVGLNHIQYYLLREAMWKTGTPPRHTAFAQSGFRRGHAWDHLLAVCATNFPEVRERGVLDRYWWHSFEGEKHLIADHPDLHLGLKGGFGRAGLADGHRRDPGYADDAGRAYLHATLGPDIACYRRWQVLFRKPYALYTVLDGAQAPPDPPAGAAPLFDCYAFCDRDLPPDSPWSAIPFDGQPGDLAHRLRKPQGLPHLYFPDYEWSVWADPGAMSSLDPGALIQTGIAAQVHAVQPAAAQGHPIPQACARRHSDPAVMRAMTAWWRAQLAASSAPLTLEDALAQAGVSVEIG